MSRDVFAVKKLSDIGDFYTWMVNLLYHVEITLAVLRTNDFIGDWDTSDYSAFVGSLNNEIPRGPIGEKAAKEFIGSLTNILSTILPLLGENQSAINTIQPTIFALQKLTRTNPRATMQARSIRS